MIDIHGFETRENCFGETPYEGYGPDEVDDPTAEEMADEYEAEGL